MKKIFNTKLYAVAALTCFLITNVCGQTVHAFADFSGAGEIIKDCESFVPFSAGKVSYAKNFNSKDIIINIQDLHCHGQSQRNTALILKNFEKYGFDEIYLEGAVENVSTRKFMDFMGTGFGKNVIEDLLSEGILSGAEYYSIKAGRPDIIKALDESGLYFENIILLGSMLENRQPLLFAVEGLKDEIEAIKKDYYSPDLLRLNKIKNGFLKGKIPAKRYYSFLTKLSKKAGIETGAYNNVEKYINLINEKGINYQKVSDELKIFVGVLKESVSYGIYRELSRRSNDFAEINELIPVFAALSDAYGICGKYGFKQLDTFFRYVKANEELNIMDLVTEEDRLIYDIGISLSDTKYEREVIFLDRFVKVLEGFFTAKITSFDYEYYLKNNKRFEETVSRYIGAENVHLSFLKQNLPLFDKYHSNNLKRDKEFFSFLSAAGGDLGYAYDVLPNDFSALKDIMESAENGANVKIVITGGFHSEGLRKQMLANKTSFVIVTPNVTEEIESAEKKYYSSVSQYYRVFTSAINKMPASSEPLQIILPKIVGSAINRARTDQMPVGQVQDIINQVFSSGQPAKNISETVSMYEPVSGAEVKIDSVNAETAGFTVTYDYGYGKHSIKYVYNYKQNDFELSVDDELVKKAYDGFRIGGSEGYGAPGLMVRYGDAVAKELENMFKELDAFSAVIALMDPSQYHTTLSMNTKLLGGAGYSSDTNVLKEPAGISEIADAKNMIGKDFFKIKPFKGKLSGHFKIMPDGGIIYQLDDPALLRGFAGVRESIQGGQHWSSPKIVHITIGRLIPGKYSSGDLSKIAGILEKYNSKNPLENTEYIFDKAVFGTFDIYGGKEIYTEEISFGAGIGSFARRGEAFIEQSAAKETGGRFINAGESAARKEKEIKKELSHFDNASRYSVSADGKYFEAAGVDDILNALEQLASRGISRYEFTFDALMPDNYSGKTSEEIRNFRRKLVSPEELYSGLKNIRDYLLNNAGVIKQKAEENNISVSMHAYSLSSNARDGAGRKISITPHPSFNGQMRDIFDWQLEIAEALGIENITVHLEDHGIDGYAEFVKKAAGKKIKINFENHLNHSGFETDDPASFYYHSLLEGFMPKNKFIETMLDIKRRLSSEEQKYLGVTFDTSKALNSYLKPLPLDAGPEEKNAELEKITLENLIDYYGAVEDAGLTINNIHLAQFSANAADIRERRSQASGKSALIIYNKADVTDLSNPHLDIAEFLRYLEKKNYQGALHQETPGIVSPSGKTGGFIGKFLRLISSSIAGSKGKTGDLSLVLLKRADEGVKDVKSFMTVYNHLKPMLEDLAAQSKDKKFQGAVKDLFKDLALMPWDAFYQGDTIRIVVPGSDFDTIEIVFDRIHEDAADFTVKYFAFDGNYIEIKYVYDFAGEKKLYRTIDEKKVLETIEKFFSNDNGALREKLSEPVIVVNMKEISKSLYDIYNDLSGSLSDGKAFFRQPEFYHFAFSANRSVFSESSQDITMVSKVGKDTLRKIESSIPPEVYQSLSRITGKLEGYFYLAPDGSIFYKVTNEELVNAFNSARQMLNQKEWKSQSDLHFSLGRLFPGKNTQKDIDAVNAVLDRYNEHNPLKDISYTFDNVLFGQFTGTGNGFVNVTQLDPWAKSEISMELLHFDNATRLTDLGYKGLDVADDERFYEASGVDDMLRAIEQISLFGLSRYEFTFDVLLPEYYSDKSEAEKRNFKKKFVSSGELYEGTKNIRDYLLNNAEIIKKKAAENRIDISMHAFSLVCNAKDRNGNDVPINPHPNFNGEMRDIFDWQLEIAEALGVKNMTVHLEDYDIDGYVEFVKKAAGKKIKINFENHMRHSDNDKKTPAAFFFYTLLGGYIDKEIFVKTMLAIKNKLTKEEQEYLGVTFDTSKALNSYLSTLPLNADFAAVNREFSKVTLENLIDYYEHIIKSGLTINNIHLAQLSANIDDIRKRGPSPDDMYLVIYNKYNIDDLINPSLSMADFLKYLRKNGYKGALHQETDGIVSPSRALRNIPGGFIGEFSAPVIFKTTDDEEHPGMSKLLVSLASAFGHSTMEVNGSFADMSDHLKAALGALSKQNKDKEFKRIMRKLIKAADGKTAGKIKFFEIESAYIEENGFKENVTDKVGGFSSNKYEFKRGGIIALRKELFWNGLALLHEFMHWALAEGVITVEEIKSVITETAIKEKFILSEPFDEPAVRKKAEAEAEISGSRYIEIEGLFSFDAVETAVDTEKQRYDSERGHGAIRAFQAQFLSDADAGLTSLIKSSSKEYRSFSAQDNEKSRQQAAGEILGRIINAIAVIAGKKQEQEETEAETAAQSEEIQEIFPAETQAKETGSKRAVRAEKQKAVRIYDQLYVYGKAKLKGKTSLVLDKDALRYLHYTPGKEVYITSFPNGDIFLFVQPEALRAFAERYYKERGYETSSIFGTALVPLRENVYPHTMDASIDAKGVLKINLSGSQINTFAIAAAGETNFILMGEEYGTIRIIGHDKHVQEILDENDDTKQILKEGARGIEETIRATESAVFFTYDKIGTAFWLLEGERTYITELLKPALESMLAEDGLNRDQKTFALLLLTVISAAENPDFEYVKRLIKKSGSVNADAFILWLEMMNAESRSELFAEVTDYLHSSALISGYGSALRDAAGSLAVFEELKRALAVTENERWLLETERIENPGKRMLYGGYFIEASLFEDGIDFEKLEALADFGIKPAALSFAANRANSDRDRLCYVNADINGETVTLEVFLRMQNNVPVILMYPLNFKTNMDYAEVYMKSASEVLDVLKNDYTVKGKFAYLTRDISMLEMIINLFSNESLFRAVGKRYDFDLKAFSFDSKELRDFENYVYETFPESADIKKDGSQDSANSGDPAYYDISSNVLRTKEFLFKVLKRLVLKDKKSESKAGTIIGEKINAKFFSLLGEDVSPLGAYGINALSSYFEKRMKAFGSAVMLLEDAVLDDSAMLADAALIDWTSVKAVKAALDKGKIKEEDLKIYGSGAKDVRSKSLELSEKIMAEIDSETKAEFDKFAAANGRLKELSPAERFAQFIIISQIKENIKKVHDSNGKIVLSLNIPEKMSKNEIIQAALFWQNAGFDGVRVNLSAGSILLKDVSVLNALSSDLRSSKSDSMIVAGLPSSFADDAVKNFAAKASELDIITAVNVSKLNDGLAEYRNKIWADINPLNDEYKSDTAKYFEDIRKVAAFGAGYLGVAAGINVISADGKSAHIEIMSRISGMLSLNKTVTPEQSYAQGYRTGLQSKNELKTGHETRKLIARELVKLQNGKVLRTGTHLESGLISDFTGFLRAEPGIAGLKFIQESLADNNKEGVYAAAGYLRGMLEATLLSEFRDKNGFDNSGSSELLRILLFLDFAMPTDAQAYSDDEFIEKTASDLNKISPDEMLQKMLEQNYGGESSAGFTDYALYVYMLKNNGATVSGIIENINILMKAHLSEANFGYGIPVSEISRSEDEKRALGQIIEILSLAEQKPKIDKSVKKAVNGSVNTLAVSMMLKAA